MYCKRTPEKISVEWWEYMMSLRDLLVRKVNIQGYTIWYFTPCLLNIVFLRKLGWHLMVQELIKPLVSKWFHFPDRIGEWKIGDRGESLWEQRRELTANLTHIIMVSTLGLKPRSHMWEASALKTVPSICDPSSQNFFLYLWWCLHLKQNYWKNCCLNWFTLIFVF